MQSGGFESVGGQFRDTPAWAARQTLRHSYRTRKRIVGSVGGRRLMRGHFFFL